MAENAVPGETPAKRPLLEREVELDRLCQLLDALGIAGGRVVLIRGEAGIGKSALVSRFLEATADRAHELLGFCDDLLTPQPLGPIWDIARQDPSLAVPLIEGDRRAVMEALVGLVSRRLRPTVLVFEDVQWADEATLDVIRFLGRRIASANGMLVLTYRDGEVDNDHPLRQVVGDIPAEFLVRIGLAPLSVGGVAALVDGTDLDAAEVLALTTGNPLFVTQMAAWGGEGVPASLRDVVLTQLNRLPGGVREVLEMLSVLPGGAALTLVERIVGSSRREIAAAIQHGLLETDGEAVWFHHELVRRTVESSLSPHMRRRFHRKVLDATEESADPARLVHHAREAGDATAIVTHAPRAARAAIAVRSHREALQHLRVLEPYLHRLAPAEQAALWEERASVESLVMPADAAVESINRAIEIRRRAGSECDLARALTLAVRPLMVQLIQRTGGSGIAEPRAGPEACAAEAVAILGRHPPGPELARALSQQAWLAMITNDDPGNAHLAERAFCLADEVGEHWSACHARNTQAMSLPPSQEAKALLEEARRRAEEHGYPDEEARALFNMADVAFEMLELRLARDLVQRAQDVAIRHDMPHFEADTRMLQAQHMFWAGDWEAAEHALVELMVSNPELEHGCWPLGSLRARRGRRDARPTLERAWYLAQEDPNRETAALVAGAFAEYLWLADENEPDLVARMMELTEAMPGWNRMTHSSHMLPFWLWQLGWLPSIPDWVARPWRLIDGSPLEAAAMWKAHGFPYQQALALMQAGEGERLDALRLFEDLGASATAARLRRLLAESGVRVPRGRAVTTRHHPAGLTARQSEVLSLLAEGLTSSQIADRLFISVRTAENHVAAILMKLDVADRHAAVETALKLGLLPPA